MTAASGQHLAGQVLDEMVTAYGWQAHSVGGFMSGLLRRRLGLTVTSQKEGDGVRRCFVAV